VTCRPGEGIRPERFTGRPWLLPAQPIADGSYVALEAADAPLARMLFLTFSRTAVAQLIAQSHRCSLRPAT